MLKLKNACLKISLGYLYLYHTGTHSVFIFHYLSYKTSLFFWNFFQSCAYRCTLRLLSKLVKMRIIVWVIFSIDEFFHWQTSKVCQKHLHKCWLLSSESESSQHYWMSETSKRFPTLFSKFFSSQWSATEEWLV